MRVNATFKRRRAASFFDLCSQNRRRLLSLHRHDLCAVLVLISKHFFSDTATESILAVSADTEYPMPVSVSPYILRLPHKGHSVEDDVLNALETTGTTADEMKIVTAVLMLIVV